MRIAARGVRSLFVSVFVLCFLLSIGIFPAHASTFTVDDLGDAIDADTGDNFCSTSGGVCTLRAAIMQADSAFSSGADSIDFSVWGTINISAELPSIATEISIDGSGGSGITVDNISAGSSRIISVNSGGILTLSNITLTGGNTANGAGVVVNSGTLNINSGTRITGNSSAGMGGGVFALGNGIVNMNAGSIDNNTAPNGAGIYLQTGADLNMIGGSINNNTATTNGGGVYATSSTSVIAITGGSISSNGASSGGGAYVTTNASLNASNALISRNTATNGSAVYRQGGSISVTISNSSIVCNNDNAIQFSAASPAMSLGMNWWGSAYGPYFSTNTQGLQCSTGDSLNSSGATLANYGITVATPQTTCEVPPGGNWLSASPVSGAPTVNVPSTMARGRVCSG